MERRVYYHDTDAGGVVYYGNYLKYLEESRTEYLEERGISCHKEFLYAVRKCNVTYKSPARYADIISCTSEITKISAAQIWFKQQILNKETGQLLVDAEVVLVSLTHDFKPIPIPDHIRNLMAS